jgi:hypothetical protein
MESGENPSEDLVTDSSPHKEIRHQLIAYSTFPLEGLSNPPELPWSCLATELKKNEIIRNVLSCHHHAENGTCMPDVHSVFATPPDSRYLNCTSFHS